MATNSRYGHIEEDDAKAHDDLLLTAQKTLLQKINGASSAGVTRGYAEAYALISGHITGTTATEIKNG